MLHSRHRFLQPRWLTSVVLSALALQAVQVGAQPSTVQNPKNRAEPGGKSKVAKVEKTDRANKGIKPLSAAAKTGRTAALTKTAALAAVAGAAVAALPKGAASKPGLPLRDGEAESRLLEVYQLIAQRDLRQALGQAEALVRDHPDFQLAQLVLGDLLSAHARPLVRVGDVPGADRSTSANVTTSLQQLREESMRRLEAQRFRPPANTIPAQFLALSERNRHAVAVDASRSRLYLFENTSHGMRLVGDYYASVGKLGIDKFIEGDQRTPLGVYFITSRLDPGTLRDFYGAGALPINYPNPLDQSRGKTGKGIWLHGTPPNQFARPPLATDGCVVIANPDLERLLRTVEPRSTPVVIAPQLQWVAPRSAEAERQRFDEVLDAWRVAKSQGDMERLQRFYAADFKSASQQSAQQWLASLTAAQGQRPKEIQLKDKSYLRWTDSADTMVVTFGEVPVGERTGTTRRQYWTRKGDQWQIFFEGVTG